MEASENTAGAGTGAPAAIGCGFYWHGVFGGLYLPHLRDAVWRNLAQAEAGLRAGERLGCEVFDFDGDGNDEIWIHSAAFSALISPARGGAVEEYTVFAEGITDL